MGKVRQSLSGGCGELGWLLVLPLIPSYTAGQLLTSQPSSEGSAQALTGVCLSCPGACSGGDRSNPKSNCWHPGVCPEELFGWEMTAQQDFRGEERCSSSPLISD